MTTRLFFSAATSTVVCRSYSYSYSAAGSAAMTEAARASLLAA